MITDTPTGIQTWIHFLEEGAGRLWVRRFLLAVLAASVVVIYHFMEARNFMSPEAMDQAQLGRNLAEHHGYKTSFIRPLSLHLLQQKAVATGQPTSGLLKWEHPDLENPPVYPLLLAGMFKVLPAKYSWGTAAEPAVLHRLPPEKAIGWLNLGLFLIVVFQVYRLGRLLFDPTVALLAATVTFGTELLWRFVYSGLSTMLVLVLVLFLARVMVALDRASRAEPPLPGRKPLLLALLAGLTLGVLFLTRYSTGLLLLPALCFLLFFGGARRWSSAAAMGLAFGLLVSPWLYRNWHLCGNPLGTAGFALFADTESFPDDKLERSLSPSFGDTTANEAAAKLITNSLELLQSDLPRYAGNWLAAFFLAGLLVPFRDPTIRRLRWFLLLSLVVLFVAQAAGQTHLSKLVPLVNSENLLVLASPLIYIFGSAMFGLLLDRVQFPFQLIRSIVNFAALMLFSLPLVVALSSDVMAIPGVVPRRVYPLADPPYRPGIIRELCDYSPPNALIASDVPWAVAWYGNRPTVWLPLHVQDGHKEDFFAIHDFQRPVQAIYLSPQTANSEWHKSFFDPNHAWFNFLLDLALRGRVPDRFPLKSVPRGYVEYGHLFCAEKAWWLRPAPATK